MNSGKQMVTVVNVADRNIAVKHVRLVNVNFAEQ